MGLVVIHTVMLTVVFTVSFAVNMTIDLTIGWIIKDCTVVDQAFVDKTVADDWKLSSSSCSSRNSLIAATW